jgi:micrococcal nuclease
MKRYMLLAFVLTLLASNAEAQASSIFGRVIEVNSGDVITIFNLNRPVRVKLLGVDAPEMDQAFGDVAKKHLSDLVYDKSVLVEYSGITADRSLSGRVLLNNTDVGAQMIRDGAAWFDFNNQSRLSTTDREIYRQSEEAARSERRGLWQAENPVAPWEFVKAEASKRNPVARLNSIASRAKSTLPSELTNLTLRVARTESSSVPTGNDPLVRWHRAGGSNWVKLRPAGETFSALVPEDGEQMLLPTEEGSSEFPVYYGQDGMSRYAVGWSHFPTYGESEQVAITGILKSFLKGFGQTYQQVGARRGMDVGFSCEPENEKNVSMNGFTGSEFDLKSCTVPAKARIFTRLVGKRRQVYLAIAFYMEEDAKVTRFIDSFIVDRAQKNRTR